MKGKIMVGGLIVALGATFAIYASNTTPSSTTSEAAPETIASSSGEPVTPSPAERTLSTSQLPLLLTTVSLANSGHFGARGIIGGALAKVEDSLLIMNGWGEIFRFNKSELTRLDYGQFPNGMGDSLENAAVPRPPMNALKALYIAYDSLRSKVYVSVQKFNVQSKMPRFNVSAISIDKGTLNKTSDWQTIFESEDLPIDLGVLNGNPQANGGRIVVTPSGLYFTIGDFNTGFPGNEDAFRAQHASSSFGKIYHHDLVSGKTKVLSIGHRNPSGLVLTQEGALLETEHGPEGGDELNVIHEGRNYGWPYLTYGTHYGSYNWPIKKIPRIDFVEPIYAWVPSPAVSSVIQVKNFHERWKGDLLVGSLKDQTLFRVRKVGDRVVFAEPMYVGHRVRDLVEFEGQIALMTDDPALVFVKADEARLQANTKRQQPLGTGSALGKCMYCHHFGETNPSDKAPTLSGVMARRIASDNFGRYSESLLKHTDTWNRTLLTKFIANPNEFAPGSGMPSLGLSNGEVAAAISALGSLDPLPAAPATAAARQP